MAELPPPPEGIVLAHFIVSDDVERSRRFYTEVLGGRVAFSGPGGLTYVALADSSIIINVAAARPTTSRRSPGHATRSRHGSAASSISGSETSPPCTPSGARGAQVPDTAETASVRDPLLHPRSRRSSDRSRADHRPGGGLDARSLAVGYPPEGLVLARFIVSDDVERSRRFYTEVLGGRGRALPESAGSPTNVALSNSCIVISAGGGPTDDKPTVTWRRHAIPTGSTAPEFPGQGHRGRVRRVERPWC